MKKNLLIINVILLLLLASCVPEATEEEIVQPNDEQSEQEVSIVPSYQLSKENYKMILPFRPSKARGVIGRQIANRVDIDEMEDGLRRHSTEVFDPAKYYYEDGQYLTKDMVYSWLDRLPTEKQLEEAVNKEIARLKEANMRVDEEKIRDQFQQGLNPPLEDSDDVDAHREQPRYLSHILEQNFLKKNEDNSVELVGVSLGIALKSVYRFQTEVGGTPYYETIKDEVIKEKGYEIAQKVLERVRKIEGLDNVPIMIGLFREEEQSSPVPGNFFAKTVVPAGDMTIGEWESIHEEYILFPSDEAKNKHFEDYDVISSFGKDISQYFPNYVGYIGEGFYINDELKKLSIEIPIEFYGSAEVVGFTQYTYGVVKGMIPNRYDLEVKIVSSKKMESFIYRAAGQDDPTVHILH